MAKRIIYLGVIVTLGVIICYALRAKGDASASMSVFKILEFKLDAKEKSAIPSKDPHQ